MMWLTACSEDEGKETPEPVPEPDQPAIVIPDTENTAPVMEQAGGTTALRFTASAAWTAEANAITRAADWISVQPTHGEAGDVTLTITTQPNNTYDERNAAIVITCGKEQKTLTVSQKQRDALLVSSNKIELEADGGDFTIQLQANVEVDYEIEENASWLTAADSKSRALDDITLAFHAEANTNKEARQATVTLSGSGLTETVTVYQAGTAPFLILSQKEYLVSAGGETIQVELRSNTDYKIQLPEAGWIAEADARAVSAYTHYFTIAPNDTYDARTAEILFTSTDGTLADTLRVTQVQQDAIVLAQQAYDLPAENSLLEFPVLANVDVTATTDVDWITPVPDARGLEEKNLRFDVSANTDSLARQGTITLNGGSAMQEIVVRQAGDKEEPELVRVEYRTGYEWHEAEYNLMLRYNAIVYRDRYYDNGEVITDTFMDVAHMVSLHPGYGQNTSSSSYFLDGNGEAINWICNITQVSNDSVAIETCTTEVPNLNRIDTRLNRDEYFLDEFDEYSISHLYEGNEFISAADVPTQGNWESCDKQTGWYFTDCTHMREIDLGYDDGIGMLYGFLRYNFTIRWYDQYLVIDGRRIDFLQYRPELHYNFTTENVGKSVVHTHECSFEFMGRNFYTKTINTITEQEYDPNEVNYFKYEETYGEANYLEEGVYWHYFVNYDGSTQDGLYPSEPPVIVKANKQPIVSTDVDWITIESIEQGEKIDKSPVYLDVYNWNIHWRASHYIGNGQQSRTGYIYLKNSQGEVIRKVRIDQMKLYDDELFGNVELIGENYSGTWGPWEIVQDWRNSGTLIYHKANTAGIMPVVTSVDTSGWPDLSWSETADDIVFTLTLNSSFQPRTTVIHLTFEDVPFDLVLTQEACPDEDSLEYYLNNRVSN